MAYYTRVEISVDQVKSARKWCRETFGPSRGDIKSPMQWYHRQYSKLEYTRVQLFKKTSVITSIPKYVFRNYFYFRDAASATLFALRWS